MAKNVWSWILLIAVSLFLGCAQQVSKYGKIVNIVNVEPGEMYVGDLFLGAKLDFDPQDVREPIFKPPTFEHPNYRIIVPVKDWEGVRPSIKTFTINGQKPDYYAVMLDGELRYGEWISNHAEQAKNIVLIAKFPWHNRTKYDIEVTLQAPQVVSASKPEDLKVKVTKHSVISPAQGGLPGGWKYAEVFLLTEEAGFNRINEPMDIGVCVRAERVKDLQREVRIMTYNPDTYQYREVPSQAYNFNHYTGRRAKAQGDYLDWPSVSCRLVFPADVPANEKRLYILVYSNPSAKLSEYASDLRISGNVDTGLGVVVENNYWKVELHEKSGQLNSYELKQTRGKQVPIYNNTTSGAVHWNPDTYAANRVWGHTFSWDPPENIYVVANGPLMYKVTRSGRMPGNPEMWCAVTYTFYAHTPYVVMSSIMETTNAYSASAIRNGEMVFDAEIFDHFAYKAKNGERRVVRTLLTPTLGIEAAALIPIDTPWICLFNGSGEYGIGAVHTQVYDFNNVDGVAATHRPFYFLYAHPQWGRPLTYFVRAHVYPFDFDDRGPNLQVPAGNLYVEEGAYFPFILGEKDPFMPLEELNEKLRNPLQIRYGG